jgi:putative ABC transport system permease protein
MRIHDTLKFSLGAFRGSRARTLLMLLAMSIGVTAVVALTALGEGARRYVTEEFSSLGTNLLIVLPGRTETTGGSPKLFIGETPRDLTLDDAQALLRHSEIKRVAPLNIGSAAISWKQREREAPVIGTTADFLVIRHWEMAQGNFLPEGDSGRAGSVCVIGQKIRKELFGANSALGEWIRIADRRFRVIGVLKSEGRSIGIDSQELVIIPVASAQALFNTSSLFRIFVETKARDDLSKVEALVIRLIKERHQGEEDVTVVSQNAVLATFDKIFNALTLTVAGIASVSLAVAGVLIMNVMLVSVSQRTPEIGLLKALGAPDRQILVLFLTEAAMLSLFGALIGLVLGELGIWVMKLLYPEFPLSAPVWAIVSAMSVALLTGLVFGALPARRAAKLEPVQALTRR